MNDHPYAIEPPAELERLSGRAGELMDAIRTTGAPLAVLEGVEGLLRQAIEALAPHQRPGPYSQSAFSFHNPVVIDPGAFDPQKIMPFSPLIGRSNPVSPRLELRAEGTQLHGHGSFPVRFVGAPQTVHGGIVAAALDELMGIANMLNDLGAFTGTLTIRYHRPTPIERDLEFSAETTGTHGRKVHSRGEIRCDGEVTASAEAVFIVPR